MKTVSEAETDRLIQLLRHGPVFAELRRGALERRELETKLGVSRATSHRYVRTLEDMGLIEKENGVDRLTGIGEEISTAVAAFDDEGRTKLRLAPMMETLRGIDPPIDVAAFDDASVVGVEYGDPYAPLTRYVSLVQNTETIRGINTCRIAPTYMEEIQGRILDGMETELIDLPPILSDIMDRYPEKCVQVCVSGYLTLFVYGSDRALPFGLVLFDERIGIALFDDRTGSLETFVDTNNSEAVEWANIVYDRYRADSIRLENFTNDGLRDAASRC